MKILANVFVVSLFSLLISAFSFSEPSVRLVCKAQKLLGNGLALAKYFTMEEAVIQMGFRRNLLVDVAGNQTRDRRITSEGVVSFFLCSAEWCENLGLTIKYMHKSGDIVVDLWEQTHTGQVSQRLRAVAERVKNELNQRLFTDSIMICE